MSAVSDTVPSVPVHRTVRADAIDLAVWEWGDPGQDTVLLVHGYPDTHAVWTGVVPLLADAFHVVAYDVRGAGESAVPADTEGYDLAHLVADMAAVIDATSPGRSVHLVGHDWGSIQSWEAVAEDGLDGRIRSFTSISGPCLEHVAVWMRNRRRLSATALRPLLRQARRSWYTAFFQVPAVPELLWRTVAPRGFRRYLRHVEGVPDGAHPAPSLARDGANGVRLYRRNLRRRMADPRPRTTDIPVQLIVPAKDRFVTPALLDDTGLHATDLHRTDVQGGHWVVVAAPDLVAGLIVDHIERVADRA